MERWRRMVSVRSAAVLAAVVFVVAGSLATLGATEGGETAKRLPEPEVVAAQGDRPTHPTASELPCTAPREAANYGLYSLGPEYQGLPLTTIIRRCDYPSPQGRANYVSYIYGDCDPNLPGAANADGVRSAT